MRNSILRCFRRSWDCGEGGRVNSARYLVTIRDAICPWCSIVEVVELVFYYTRKFYLKHNINSIKFYLLTNRC